MGTTPPRTHEGPYRRTLSQREKLPGSVKWRAQGTSIRQSTTHRPWASIDPAGSARDAGSEDADPNNGPLCRGIVPAMVRRYGRRWRPTNLPPTSTKLGCFGKFTPSILSCEDGCFRYIWVFKSIKVIKLSFIP